MTHSNAERLRNHAWDIWRAGVEAVRSEQLVQSVIQTAADGIAICGESIRLADVNRIAVVGAGKAGAGMATAFEEAVGPAVLEKVSGWVNVPADCVRELQKIHLHSARPAGVNEPTEAGVLGSEQILRLIQELETNDVCIVLISGGGSALMPAPVEGISLADKQAVTRLLMHSGATIQELNTVRKQLSRLKGGRLAKSTLAGRVISLIISDVIGDPLDVIASGPTVQDPAGPQDAIAILQKFDPSREKVPPSVWRYLENNAESAADQRFPTSRVRNHIIGNNQKALAAAYQKARELGYRVESLGSNNAGEARNVGGDLARKGEALQDDSSAELPVCLLSGGEPIVNLAKTDKPQKGGRNQEVALSAIVELWDGGMDGLVLLSGGTDGEDGPTDAAGGIADAMVLDLARNLGLNPAEFLAINNSYPFLESTGGLVKTGPTHTNVMDLRVMLVSQRDD